MQKSNQQASKNHEPNASLLGERNRKTDGGGSLGLSDLFSEMISLGQLLLISACWKQRCCPLNVAWTGYSVSVGSSSNISIRRRQQNISFHPSSDNNTRQPPASILCFMRFPHWLLQQWDALLGSLLSLHLWPLTAKQGDSEGNINQVVGRGMLQLMCNTNTDKR